MFFRRKPGGQDSRDAMAVAPPAGVLPLAAVEVGNWVSILALECDQANGRLMAMGLMPGAKLQVVSRTAMGSVVVARQNVLGATASSDRLGLGADMAQRIQTVLEPDPTRADRNTAPEVSRPSLTLGEADLGARLSVLGYESGAGAYKRKLLAMGLTPGTELQVRRRAPLGDPIEIEVRGFHLSVRKHEAAVLIVALVPGGES